MTTTLFDDNYQTLAYRSPEAAAIVAALSSEAPYTVTTSASGHFVVECDGRPLDSRRDPVATAERAAASVAADPVVIAGIGSGYFASAVRERGIRVAAIVEARPTCLAAAMRARDLRQLLAEVPVVFLETLKDPVELATLRAKTGTIVAHAPSVALSADMAALVAAWPSIRVARRRPRVLVVGPIYGGSLEIARSARAACNECGADTRLFDGSVFEHAHHAFGNLGVPTSVRFGLQNRFASLVSEAVVAAAAEWKPDLVLALAQAPLGEEALRSLSTLGITTAFWFVENSRVLRYWRDVAPHYNWFYTIQKGRLLEELSEVGAPHPVYLPVACDPERHLPLDLSPEEMKRFACDVSFAGSPYLNRRRTLPALADFNLRLWGPGWDDPTLSPYVAEGGRRFTLDDMTKIFAASKINLNLHSANHVSSLDPEPDYVNPRTFELAACQAFQLVDSRDSLRDLFREDEVVSFSSVAELRALVARYLPRERERRETAVRARCRALAEHTYTHRVQRILRDTVAPELIAAARAGVATESLDDAIARMERNSSCLTEDEAVLRVVREVNLAWAGR